MRQPLPRVWLMTDERLPDVCAAVAALPPGSGVVFRHYSLPATPRRALFVQISRIARRRRHVLLLAAPPAVARAWGAAGAHDRSCRRSLGLRTVAVHDGTERIAARRVGADLMFVSPVLATRSHTGARPIGFVRAGLITGRDRARAIALGGMTRATQRRARRLGFHGWAAIDGLADG